MRALSKREARIVAVGLLIIALLVLYVGVARPYVSVYGHNQQVMTELQERLTRYQTIADTRPEIVRRLEQLRDDPQLTRYYLNNESVALASAELQQYVKRTVADSGGRLVSTQAVPPPKRADTLTATIKVRMRGTSDTIYQLFHRLESEYPLLALDNIRVQAGRVRRKTKMPKGTESLDIRFDLTGYVRPAAS